jgi:hypothetical protein
MKRLLKGIVYASIRPVPIHQNETHALAMPKKLNANNKR